MAHIITAQNSNQQATGDAFIPDADTTLIVKSDGFLISETLGNGATLVGDWTITLDGEIAGFGAGQYGLDIDGGSSTSATLTVNKTGVLFGAQAGLSIREAATITNKGIIHGTNYSIQAPDNGFDNLLTIINSGSIVSDSSVGMLLDFKDVSIKNSGSIDNIFIQSHTVTDTIVNSGSIGFISMQSGTANITNSGTISAALLSSGDDTFTNFIKVGKIVKSGVLQGSLNMAGGSDHFFGGAHAETVQDGGGSDFYIFGGGNDRYLASGAASDGTDQVNGGAGIDNYEAASATGPLTINLDTVVHGVAAAQSATGTGVGTDTVIGFENVLGGSGADIIYGSKGANTIVGLGSADTITGLGGRDTLEGDAGNDSFVFTKLSDSGVTATTRDTILDFTSGADQIDVSAIDANGALAGDPQFDFVGFAKFSGAHQIREAFSGNNTIVSGDLTGDGKADFTILLRGHVLLHDTDFNL